MAVYYTYNPGLSALMKVMVNTVYIWKLGSSQEDFKRFIIQAIAATHNINYKPIKNDLE